MLGLIHLFPLDTPFLPGSAPIHPKMNMGFEKEEKGHTQTQAKNHTKMPEQKLADPSRKVSPSRMGPQAAGIPWILCKQTLGCGPLAKTKKRADLVRVYLQPKGENMNDEAKPVSQADYAFPRRWTQS